MENIKLGFVSELSELSSPFYPVKTKQVAYYVEPFRRAGFEIFFFPWYSLNEGGIVSSGRWYGDDELSYDVDLNRDVDMILTRQLGKIFAREKEFYSFLDKLSQINKVQLNSPDVMRSNLDKQYLVDLYNLDFPVIPSRLFNTNKRSIESLLNGTSDMDFIFKPRVLGEGGNGIIKASKLEDISDDDLRVLVSGEYILQPFMPEISDGEFSMIYLGDKFSHGICKRSTSGDFRVNDSFGKSLYSVFEPTFKEIALGKDVVSHYRDYSHLVRIDFIRTSFGPKIMEVERVNPATYIDCVEGISDSFAKNFADFARSVYFNK